MDKIDTSIKMNNVKVSFYAVHDTISYQIGVFLTSTKRMMVKENFLSIYTTNAMIFIPYSQFSLHHGIIPLAPVYELLVSQSIRQSLSYLRKLLFLYPARLLTISLLEEGNVSTRLRSSQQAFYGRHHHLVNVQHVQSIPFHFCLPWLGRYF